MDLNHFLRHFQRRRRQRRQPAIARPTAICAPSPPGGPASGAHRSEGGGRSDGRRSTCPRALGRGGLWRARERWRRWPRPAGRTPRSACRAPPPFGPVGPRQKYLGAETAQFRAGRPAAQQLPTTARPRPKDRSARAFSDRQRLGLLTDTVSFDTMMTPIFSTRIALSRATPRVRALRRLSNPRARGQAA